MSTFIDDAAKSEEEQGPASKHTRSNAKNSTITPLTRLPTVMTRKEPKVKPPPPPRPDSAAAGVTEGQEGEAGAEDGGTGQYSGMNKEQLLEEFRAKQAEREAARRKAMDAEVRRGVFSNGLKSRRPPQAGAGRGGQRRDVAGTRVKIVQKFQIRARDLSAFYTDDRAKVRGGLCLMCVYARLHRSCKNNTVSP